MSTAVLRAVASTLVALTLVVGAAGAVGAAEPTIQPTVGGTLSVAGNVITVYSNGNVPAHVTLTAESVALSDPSFDIQPGESHDLTFTGKATGTVTALYTVVTAEGQEGGSAALTIGLSPVPPPPPSPLGPIMFVIVIIAAAGLILRRLRPWRWRIVTNPERVA